MKYLSYIKEYEKLLSEGYGKIEETDIKVKFLNGIFWLPNFPDDQFPLDTLGYIQISEINISVIIPGKSYRNPQLVLNFDNLSRQELTELFNLCCKKSSEINFNVYEKSFWQRLKTTLIDFLKKHYPKQEGPWLSIEETNIILKEELISIKNQLDTLINKIS